LEESISTGKSSQGVNWGGCIVEEEEVEVEEKEEFVVLVEGLVDCCDDCC